LRDTKINEIPEFQPLQLLRDQDRTSHTSYLTWRTSIIFKKENYVLGIHVLVGVKDEQITIMVYRKAGENLSILRKGCAWSQLDPKLMTVVADRVFGTEFAGRPTRNRG
jgi:hypothetical protein